MGSGDAELAADVDERLLSHELLAFSAHGGHHLFINRIPPRLPKEECESLILLQVLQVLHPSVLQVSKCSVIPQNSLKNKGYGFITLNGSPSQADLKSIATSLNNKLQVGCRTLGVRVCTDCHSALLEEDSSASSSSQDSSSPNEPGSCDLPESFAIAVDAQLFEVVPVAVVTLASAEDGAPAAPCRAAVAPKPPPPPFAALEMASHSGSAAGPGPGSSSRRRKGGKQHEHSAATDGSRPSQGQPGQEPGRGRHAKARALQAAGPTAEGNSQKQSAGPGRGSGAASSSERRPTQAHAQQLQQGPEGAAVGDIATEAFEGAWPLEPPPAQQPEQLAGGCEPGGAAAASHRSAVQLRAQRAASPTAPLHQQHQTQPTAQPQASLSSLHGRGPHSAMPPPPPTHSASQVAGAPPAPPPPPPAQAQQAYAHVLPVAPSAAPALQHPSSRARSAWSPLHGPHSAGAMVAVTGPQMRHGRAQAVSSGHGYQLPLPAPPPHSVPQEPQGRPAGPNRLVGPASTPSLYRSSAPPAVRYQQQLKSHYAPPYVGVAGFVQHGGGGGARRPPPPMLAAEAPDAAYSSPRQEYQAAWCGGRRSGGDAPEACGGPGRGPSGGRGASLVGSCASAPHLHPNAQHGRYYQHQHIHRHQQPQHSAGSAAQVFAQSQGQAHALLQSAQPHHPAPHQHHQHYRPESAHHPQQLPPQLQQLNAHPQQQQQRQLLHPTHSQPASSQVHVLQHQHQHSQQRPLSAQFAQPAASLLPSAATLANLQMWLGSTGLGLGTEAQRGESPLPLVASEPPGLGTWRVDSLDLDGLGRHSDPRLLNPVAHGSSNGAAVAGVAAADTAAAAALSGQLHPTRGSSDGLLDPDPISAPGLDLDQSDELDPLALEPMIMQLLENDDDDDYPPARYNSLTQPQTGTAPDWHGHNQGLRMHHQLNAFGSVPVRSQMPELALTGPSSFNGGGGMAGASMAAWIASRSKSATGTAVAESAVAALHAHGVAAAVAAAWGQPAPEAVVASAAAPRVGFGNGATGRGLSRDSCGTLRSARGGKGVAADSRGFTAARVGGAGCFEVGSLAASSLPNANLLAYMQRRDV